MQIQKGELQSARLGLVPNLVHLGKGHFGQVAALFFGLGFEVIEAADEFLVGAFEGVVGIDMIEAGGIDEAEEHIAKLGFGLFLVHMPPLGLNTRDFFPHLVPPLSIIHI